MKKARMRGPFCRHRGAKAAATHFFLQASLSAFSFFEQSTLSSILPPAWLAANLQSWRKYIEHVGLTGATVRSGTRSIVSEGWLGQFVAFTLLHEPYHGVHHQHAGLSHAELPFFANELTPETPDELPPFPSSQPFPPRRCTCCSLCSRRRYRRSSI